MLAEQKEETEGLDAFGRLSRKPSMSVKQEGESEKEKVERARKCTYYFMPSAKEKSKPLEFRKERSGGHWYVPYKGNLFYGNEDKMNKFRDKVQELTNDRADLQGARIMLDGDRAEKSTADVRIMLCMFFWFTELYFMCIQKRGLKEDQETNFLEVLCRANNERLRHSGEVIVEQTLKFISYTLN